MKKAPPISKFSTTILTAATEKLDVRQKNQCLNEKECGQERLPVCVREIRFCRRVYDLLMIVSTAEKSARFDNATS